MSNIMGPFEFGSRISRHAGGSRVPGFDCSMPELAAADPSQYVRLFQLSMAKWLLPPQNSYSQEAPSMSLCAREALLRTPLLIAGLSLFVIMR